MLNDAHAHLQSVLDENFPHGHAPGCALMLWKRGQPPVIACRGLANLENREPVTDQTTFRLASVTKQFTATAILQLAARDLLRLDQTLTDFFPGFPGYGSVITVEHLLRHTSGVKDYEALMPEDQQEQITDSGVLQLVAEQEDGDFSPGERFRYSNTGYALLAMIIKAVSGQDYPDYLKDHIFPLAGMQTALAYVNAPGKPEPRHRAFGYGLDTKNQFSLSDQNATTAVLGDGGIYCSASDYSRWIAAYLNGKILSAADVSRAFQPGQLNDGTVIPYGYGWRLQAVTDQENQTHTSRAWQPYHPGSTCGFRNGVVLDPDLGWAAVALTNRRNGDAIAVAKAAATILR